MKTYLYSEKSFIEIGNIASSKLGVKQGISVFEIDDMIKTKFLAVAVFCLSDLEEKEIKDFFENTKGKVLMVCSEERKGYKKEYAGMIKLVNSGKTITEAINAIKTEGIKWISKT